MDVNANLKHTLPIKQILIKRKMYLCVCLKFLLFLILSGNADLEKQKILWLVSLHRAAVVCDSPEASPDLIPLKHWHPFIRLIEKSLLQEHQLQP